MLGNLPAEDRLGIKRGTRTTVDSEEVNTIQSLDNFDWVISPNTCPEVTRV